MREGEALTDDNVARMRRAYEAVRARDLELVFELIHPDVVMRDRPEIPDPRTYRGRDGVIQALAVSDESFDSFDMVPTDLVAVGDHVVVTLKMSGRGRESGVPVEETIAHLWTLRDGKAVELQVYSDPEDALRDAQVRTE